MLKLDLKKEIGELGALVIAFIIGFVASSFLDRSYQLCGAGACVSSGI